jgi:hypothetical protein
VREGYRQVDDLRHVTWKRPIGGGFGRGKVFVVLRDDATTRRLARI